MSKMQRLIVKIIDLSHGIYDGFPVYPGLPPPRIKQVMNVKVHGANVESLSMTPHTGTHVDAPYHAIEDGLRINEIELRRFIIKSTLLRIQKRPGEEITKKDLEENSSIIKADFGIVIDTGFWKLFPREPETYFKKFPYFTSNSIDYLIDKGIKLLGVDTPAIDQYGTGMNIHKRLFKANVPLIECLTNLDELSHGEEFLLICLPLNLIGCSGAPARVIAIKDISKEDLKMLPHSKDHQY